MCYLVVLDGPRWGTVHSLGGGPQVAGRGPGTDIALAHGGVSARHCRFERRGSWTVVRDLGSSNGTLLNGRSVQSAALRDGDVLTIGGVSLIFRAEARVTAWDGPFGRHPAGRPAPIPGLVDPFSEAALRANHRAYLPPGLAQPREAG